MPQSRTQTSTQGSTSAPTVAPSGVGAGAAEGNSFLTDVLAGRTRVDGDAKSWFDRGITLQRGMKGTVIADLQKMIGAGADGAFGPGTEKALIAFQRKNGLAADGSVDATDWQAIQMVPRMENGRPKGEGTFAKMWESHPHNYLPDASQNTSSTDLNKELGFGENQFENTCALRMSTMLNRMGGDFKITKEKAVKAGLDKMRSTGLYLPQAKDPKTEAQDDRVIVAAKEMWTYLEKTYGAPDICFPPRGRNLKRADAEKAAADCQAAVQGRKGFIAFDNLQLQDESGQFTGYAGSGHVDIFDGGQLSDGSFYPCQRIMVWYVV